MYVLLRIQRPYMHPGTAGTFGSIERLIGPQQEGIKVSNVCCEGSNPNTHRDLQRQPRGLNEWSLYGKSNPLGNGGGFSVREVLTAAEAVVGRPIPFTVGPRRAGDPPVLVARSTRAADVLGWRPARPSLQEMVGSAWEWRRTHPGGYPD